MFSLFFSFEVSAQLFDPFDIRFVTSQKGGITMLSNVSVSCGSSGGCTSAQSQVPPSGTSSNENFSMSYVDVDGLSSTFMSSSDSLNFHGRGCIGVLKLIQGCPVLILVI